MKSQQSFDKMCAARNAYTMSHAKVFKAVQAWHSATNLLFRHKNLYWRGEITQAVYHKYKHITKPYRIACCEAISAAKAHRHECAMAKNLAIKEHLAHKAKKAKADSATVERVRSEFAAQLTDKQREELNTFFAAGGKL